jgi:adenylate cyclase
MSRPSKALVLGSLLAAAGLLLSFLPTELDLEESFGLPLLFKLRGARPAPADVVVVALDKESAQALGPYSEMSRWPRALHARLVEGLARAGASVVVFDLFFEDPSGEDDREFADVLGRAGNVVLARYLARETVTVQGATGSSKAQATVEQARPPLPLLAAAAVASAPFPLPKIPVTMSQYWTFKPGAGGMPSLPVVAVQVAAADLYDDLMALWAHAGQPPRDVPRDRKTLIAARHLEDALTSLRDAFESDAGALERIRDALVTMPSTARRDRLAALVAMYSGPSSRFLNFYGPPGTIYTIPYHRALREVVDAPATFRGKAVFVGVSEHLRPEQRDGFHTVFSSESGLDLSGVEIAATAYANLREDGHVRPVSPSSHAAVVIGAGLMLGVAGTLLAPVMAATGIAIGGALYAAAAYQLFVTSALWLPLAIPVFVQAPLALFMAVAWWYADTSRERGRIRKLFSYYLPEHEINRLLSEVPGITTRSRLVYGICLSTDAERYTTLAETLDPDALAPFLNSYYASIFEPVKRHGGMVSDVEGDGALAIWAAAAPDRDLRARACRAACDIARAVDAFNAASPQFQLPTRIGLHSGQMMLGNVGAVDHYEFRAVGDIVNTAARIQELNKHLGTRLLVSEEVLEGLDEFLTRRLGTFLLAGKTRPLVIHELICRHEEAEPGQILAVTQFGAALAEWERCDLGQAAAAFGEMVERCGDPASRFYLESCERYAVRLSAEPFDSVIRVSRR